MKNLLKKGKRSNKKQRQEAYREIVNQDWEETGRIELIQTLIPLGLRAVEEELQSSYRDLQNPGSIDEVVFRRLINGISSRKYERAV